MGNVKKHEWTARMACEWQHASANSVNSLLARFDDDNTCTSVEMHVLELFGVNTNMRVPIVDVKRGDGAEGLHVGVHAGSVAANDLMNATRDVSDAKTLANRIHQSMAGRFDGSSENKLRLHLRANIAFSLRPHEYDKLVAMSGQPVNIGRLLPEDSIVAMIECPHGMSTFDGIDVHYAADDFDVNNKIAIGTNEDVLFIDAIDISDGVASIAESDDVYDEAAIKSACTLTKGDRFVAVVVPSMNVAMVAVHIKFVPLAGYEGGFPAFCADYAALLLRSLQALMGAKNTLPDIPALNCRVVGDFNLQTVAAGNTAADRARVNGHVLFNAGSVCSPALRLTAFNTTRNIAGTEQLSKVGMNRDKPSMIIVAPSHSRGTARALVECTSTPSSDWPLDHVAIVHTISGVPGILPSYMLMCSLIAAVLVYAVVFAWIRVV